MILLRTMIKWRHLSHFCGKSLLDQRLYQIQTLWYLQIFHVWGPQNRSAGHSMTRRRNRIAREYLYWEIRTGACSMPHLSRTECFLSWFHKIVNVKLRFRSTSAHGNRNFWEELGFPSLQILWNYPGLKSFGKSTPAITTPRFSK